ncbi:hypothetical protein BG015_008620 [Linnemannia schmuckeri]|uniref:Uncharacterized protein n=1 Tax=Linnemannia schmuckeri TaxID=64567 RepID=A0A9P5VAE2_9FUNG|nr:hypothetical protein BG015_008620 [Linnemannia schmuckeri]
MVSRLDPELIIESEKTAARVRQERKALQKTQGERSSRRQLGLEAEAVPDDPEMFLRHSHRASHTHNSANGVAGRVVATGEEEADDEEVTEASNRRAGYPNRPQALKQEDLDLDLDDDMSGTSLSMSSSTTSLFAFSSDPVEPTADDDTSEATTSAVVAKTEEQANAKLSVTTGTDGIDAVGEQEKHSMDIDTRQPLQNDDGNDASTNGIVKITTSSSLHIDPAAAASSLPSTEDKATSAVVDRDMEMTSGEHGVSGSSTTPGSPSATSIAATSDPISAQPADEAMDTSVMDAIIPDQDPTTASLVTSEDQSAAAEPIKEQTPTPPSVLILDTSEVALLRQTLVDKTDNSTVEELDQLRAALYEDLWEHRLQWDKGPMLQDMNDTVESITSLHKETAEDVRNYNAVLQEIS